MNPSDRLSEPTPSRSAKVDRRALIKRTLTIGALSYTAPAILGSSIASAGEPVVSPVPCSSPGCGSVCGTNGQNSCFCFTTTEGNLCVQPLCTQVCSTSANCPAGWVCSTPACCQAFLDGPALEQQGVPQNRCVPLCGTTIVLG